MVYAAPAKPMRARQQATMYTIEWVWHPKVGLAQGAGARPTPGIGALQVCHGRGPGLHQDIARLWLVDTGRGHGLGLHAACPGAQYVCSRAQRPISLSAVSGATDVREVLGSVAEALWQYWLYEKAPH